VDHNGRVAISRKDRLIKKLCLAMELILAKCCVSYMAGRRSKAFLFGDCISAKSEDADWSFVFGSCENIYIK
jgi:hypothetical protein